MSFRSILTEKIKLHVPDGTIVYQDGQDVVATPCIVVMPADPYITPTTMAGGPLEQSVNAFLNVTVVANRGEVSAAMDELEEMRRIVALGVMSDPAPIGRWLSFGGFGLIEIAGVSYASALVQVMLTSTDVPV